MLYYTVEDTNGCSSLSTDSLSINVVDCLGLDDEVANPITIYPNPFSNYTTIYFEQQLYKNSTVIVYNMLGEIVYKKENISNNTLEINKNELGLGVYILSVYESHKRLKELFTTKLIVE